MGRAGEEERRITSELSKMRREALFAIISNLNEGQRARFYDLYGEAFDFDVARDKVQKIPVE